MIRRRRRYMVVILGAAALAVCASLFRSAQSNTQTGDQSGPAQPPSVRPPAIEPKATPFHPLADVASIVEADVAKVTTAYDDRLGPRRVIELTNIVVHAGAPLPETTFSQLGGGLPDGRYVEIHELPEFSAGSRYILFFSKQASVYTPVWARLAFRIEQLSNKPIVLGPDGHMVVHIGSDGIRFGAAKLIADSADRRDPTAAHVFDKSAAELDADTPFAVGPRDFVDTARQVAMSVGAPLGAGISLAPSPNVRWNVDSTSPQ
jgi:hypothetical protein